VKLAYLLIAAGGCWVLSEGLEVLSGGRNSLTLWLTAAFHLLIASGIWGAYAGQSGGRSGLSRLAAGTASLGYLILVYPPVAVSQAPSMTIGDFMSANPFFGIAGVLATLGIILFGISVLRYKSYPLWTGVVLIISPVIFAAIMMSEGPEPIGIAANVVEGIALIAMGKYALRSQPG